jgi:hypothetical protein
VTKGFASSLICQTLHHGWFRSSQIQILDKNSHRRLDSLKHSRGDKVWSDDGRLDLVLKVHVVKLGSGMELD